MSQTITEFYRLFESNFPEVDNANLFDDLDLEKIGFEHALLMTELAKILVYYAKENRVQEVKLFLGIIEKSFKTAHSTIINYIYTDFLVTIIETRKNSREFLKENMGIETRIHYERLLSFYQELN